MMINNSKATSKNIKKYMKNNLKKYANIYNAEVDGVISEIGDFVKVNMYQIEHEMPLIISHFKKQLKCEFNKTSKHYYIEVIDYKIRANIVTHDDVIVGWIYTVKLKNKEN